MKHCHLRKACTAALWFAVAHFLIGVSYAHKCRRTYTAEETRIADLSAIKKRLCNSEAHECMNALAQKLGFDILRYPASNELAFYERFKDLSFRATPWLSFGRTFFDFTSSERLHSENAFFFYANNYVDLSLFNHFFARPEPVFNGVYVEIGGSNGVHASNTLFFEQHLNWTGYLIEPTPCAECALTASRPRDVIIKAGCCVNSTVLNGTYMRNFCPAPQDACIEAKGGYEAYAAACEPMHKLLRSKDGDLPPHVDLLSIDVEGNFMAVLKTFPWAEVSVDVLIVEVFVSRIRKPYTKKKVAARFAQIRSDEADVRAFLELKGFHMLQVPFDGDLVAVRKDCVREPQPES